MSNPAIAGNTAEAFGLLMTVLAGKGQPAPLRTWAILMSQVHVQGRDLTTGELAQITELAASFGVAATLPVTPPPPALPAPPDIVVNPPPEITAEEALRNAAAYFVKSGDDSYLQDAAARLTGVKDEQSPEAAPTAQASATP